MTEHEQPLWVPRPDFPGAAKLKSFQNFVKRTRGLDLQTYEALREWSVSDLPAFWSAVWEFFDVLSDTPYTSVLRMDGNDMSSARWFEGSRVNYAEHLLRAGAPDAIALHSIGSPGGRNHDLHDWAWL